MTCCPKTSSTTFFSSRTASRPAFWRARTPRGNRSPHEDSSARQPTPTMVYSSRLALLESKPMSPNTNFAQYPNPNSGIRGTTVFRKASCHKAGVVWGFSNTAAATPAASHQPSNASRHAARQLPLPPELRIPSPVLNKNDGFWLARYIDSMRLRILGMSSFPVKSL